MCAAWALKRYNATTCKIMPHISISIPHISISVNENSFAAAVEGLLPCSDGLVRLQACFVTERPLSPSDVRCPPQLPVQSDQRS